MKSTMKNELNTAKSQGASRKSCCFALGVGLLLTLLFASGAHAQSNCAYSQTGGTWALICPATNNSGYVWVAANDSWSALLYYATDQTFNWFYNYPQNLWSLENRVTHEQFVQDTRGWSIQGNWIRYDEYNARETEALFSLATLALAAGGTDVTSAAPIITIVPKDEVAEICGYGRFLQQLYQDRGYPKVPLGSMCGQ
jgi:hypothetical protein